MNKSLNKTAMPEQVLRRLPSGADLSQKEDYMNSSERRVLRSCPRICIGGMKENRPVVTAEEIGVVLGDGDVEYPVIRLNLRKPRNWNWKLTTSASSPAVILPVIHLVDNNGNVLLHDAADDKVRERFSGTRNINQCITLNRECDRGSIKGITGKHRRETTSIQNTTNLGKYGKSSAGESERNSIRDSNQKSRKHKKENNPGNTRLDRVVSRDLTGNIPDLLLGATLPGTMSHRDSVGRNCHANKMDSKEDSREMPERRQTRKQDSGYKSLRRNASDKSDDKRKTKYYVKNKVRAPTKVSQQSSSSEEDVEEVGEMSRRKKKHRQTSLIGDRLVSINGHDPSSYDHAVDLLRSATDIVHLKLSSSHRHHDSTTSSSRRSKRRQQRQNPISPAGMGSNVSRHSEKGLSGRRTQSSGNLCNGNKLLARDVGRILTSCSNVGPKDRNKFCGSLPNHLDGEYGDNELEEAECCNNNNGGGDAYVVVTSRVNGDVGATTSSTMKNEKNAVELRLMPHHDLTALHDQGYGSERSPEDEHLPPLPVEPDPFWSLAQHYPFITPDTSFEVCLLKGNRGLGLSVTGGVDTAEQWPGLIRIKRLFPNQPAWESGQLSAGDIVLAANGVALTGLTNYQALEVLRTTPNNVVLVVCRPPSDVFQVSAPSEPPPPPRRDPALSISSSRILVPLPLVVTDEPYGEFDITLTKVNRSLGFTLRKEDESVLGHYVRALVREPALSDGRIRPGDKIVAVNDMPMSPMSHEEAVTFLRQCGDNVRLRLYRDAAQTPVAALSPSEDGPTKPKPVLRQEAMDMLTDLAVRKLSPGNSSGSGRRLSDGQSPGTSPRRRRLTKTPSPDIQAVAQDRLGQRYLVPSPVGDTDYSRDPSRSNTFSLTITDDSNPNYEEDCVDGDESKPRRPKFLDLCSESDNLPPTAPRKQKYTFSASGSRNDDAWGSLALTNGTEDLTNLGSLSHCYPRNGEAIGSLSMEPASLPPLSSTSSTSTAFSYRNPAYQSAHPACNVPKKSTEEEGTDRLSDQDIPTKALDSDGDGTRGLLKWKGVMFTPGSNNGDGGNVSVCTETSTVTEEVLAVELNRGWNSRLGFSLQGDGTRTFISAIYSDSVAAKDGRLQANDQLLTVNEENIEGMSTEEIIDLLRKIRGTIEIRVLRKSGPNPQIS